MTATATQTLGSLRLRGDHDSARPEWLDTLHKRGWVVVKGVLPRDKAVAYADRAYGFVESFGLGFDRNDPTSYVKDKMPYFWKGGLFHRYGASHEPWVWDIKQEPAIVDKFAQVWGTDQLVASFDGVNISLPIYGREQGDDAYKPWPHVDQSPLKTHLHCIQGLMNLLPNGPDDGGLMVLDGSKPLYKELFDTFDDQKPARGWNKADIHDFSPEQIQWYIDQGCEWHKVCCEPGDLLLWDSRTVHYGATPTSGNARVATYVCYKPASMLMPEIKAKRREAWDNKLLTSHDPITFRNESRRPPESHPTYNHPKVFQLQEPSLSPLGRKLAGVDDW